MGRILVFLGAVVCAWSATANAQVQNSRMIGDWYVADLQVLGSLQCTAQRSYPDGTELALTLARDGRFKIDLSNSDWSSLNSLEANSGLDITLPVNISFDGTGKDWSGNFTVLRQSRFNPKPHIYHWFEGDEMVLAMTSLFSASSALVKSDHRVIGNFVLPGSSKALSAVTDCWERGKAEDERRQSNDPFKK